MLAKLAALLHSKIGIAIVGAVLVAGGGAAVATATGATSHLPLVSFAQDGSHNHGDDDATKTPGGIGEHQEVHGVVASVNSAGSSFVLTVKHEADDGHSDSGDEHGTPTTTATSTPSTVTVTVTADTKFEGVTKSFADLKAGMKAEVGGALQSDGSFLAVKVEAGNDAENDNDEDDAHQEAEVSGVVMTVGATSFTLHGEHGTATVTVSNTTTFEGVKGIADLKVGMHVEVKGTKQSNGSISAQRVQVDDGGHSGGN
ncbi:MAG TPA: DUF5666 domain-containing protein [Ktedonobacterales bacterium]|jgi:hypothetical protein